MVAIRGTRIGASAGSPEQSPPSLSARAATAVRLGAARKAPQGSARGLMVICLTQHDRPRFSGYLIWWICRRTALRFAGPAGLDRAHTDGVTISVALVADADAAAQSAADRSGLRVTELVEFAEHEAAVELLREVWGVDSAEELVNSSLLRALAHSGNYVAGAYAGTRLVGAAVAFLGVGHHRRRP